MLHKRGGPTWPAANCCRPSHYLANCCRHLILTIQIKERVRYRGWSFMRENRIEKSEENLELIILSKIFSLKHSEEKKIELLVWKIKNIFKILNSSIIMNNFRKCIVIILMHKSIYSITSINIKVITLACSFC